MFIKINQMTTNIMYNTPCTEKSILKVRDPYTKSVQILGIPDDVVESDWLRYNSDEGIFHFLFWKHQ